MVLVYLPSTNEELRNSPPTQYEYSQADENTATMYLRISVF